ncbi:sulfatase-like hydrolase/transferase [Bacteroidota bacterium]
MKNKIFNTIIILVLSIAASISCKKQSDQPNIVWILAEDASPHLGCYGETTIQTPYIDNLAAEGVKFNRAFITSPVCSPSRSAMISGMYQTTLGAHNHRSQGEGRNKDYRMVWNDDLKRKGNEQFYDSYKIPEEIALVPEIFKEAGYYTVLAKPESFENNDTIWGKTDYNFIWDRDMYDSDDWNLRPDKKPFFAQIDLHGGKSRNIKIENPVDPAKVQLPPYYPDDPVIREDWANYLNTWKHADNQLGEIMEKLKREGLLNNTIIFFWTDHGISHARGKQFLYEEGIHIPMIVWFPDKHKGVVKNEFVTQIDIAATSLALAGIDIPAYMQGKDLFAEDFKSPGFIVSARDRCDETIETIRCVRSDKYKYIRNFYAHLPHAQPNIYKDSKEITKRLRYLHNQGKLNELQDCIFQPTRPPEELYDLENDPFETKNLAGDDSFRDILEKHRRLLYTWMKETGDLGLIPEPEAELLGKKAGNKYYLGDYVRQIFDETVETIEAGEKEEISELLAKMESPHATVRYWAATKMGVCSNKASIQVLKKHLNDESSSVRIASALALCRLNDNALGIPVLEKEAKNISNPVAQMYALSAMEKVRHQLPFNIYETVNNAQESSYEFSRRLARRLTNYLENKNGPEKTIYQELNIDE